jgi:hypothetical protein
MAIHRCAAGFAVLIILATSAWNENDAWAQVSPWRERFETEAPGKWASYETLASRLQGKVSITKIDRAAGGRVLDRKEWELKQRPPCALYVSQNHEPARDGKAVVANSSYAFILGRISPNSPWVLTNLQTDIKDGVTVDTPAPNDRVLRAVCHHLTIFNRFIPDLVKQQEFHLGNIAVESHGGEGLVKVEFDYRPKDTQNNPIRSGWMLLDPEHYWTLREYKVRAEWPDANGTIAANVACTIDDTGFPILKRYNRHHIATSSKVDHEYLYDYDLAAEKRVPEHEFTLSAFGLPEPEGVRRLHAFLWVTGAGALCLALSIVLRRVVGRARS